MGSLRSDTCATSNPSTSSSWGLIIWMLENGSSLPILIVLLYTILSTSERGKQKLRSKIPLSRHLHASWEKRRLGSVHGCMHTKTGGRCFSIQ